MMRSPFKSFVVGLVLALVGGIWAIGSYIYVVFEKPIAPNPEGSSILLIPRGTPYSQVKKDCLLYTSPSPRDPTKSRMPSSA